MQVRQTISYSFWVANSEDKTVPEKFKKRLRDFARAHINEAMFGGKTHGALSTEISDYQTLDVTEFRGAWEVVTIEDSDFVLDGNFSATQINATQ